MDAQPAADGGSNYQAKREWVLRILGLDPMPNKAAGAAVSGGADHDKYQSILAHIFLRIPDLAGDAAQHQAWLKRAEEAQTALARGSNDAFVMIQQLGKEMTEAAAKRRAVEGPRKQFERAAKAWQSAVEKVDGQIAKLQATLRASPDARLQGIAERGMNDMTGRHKVKLMTALYQLRGAEKAGLAKAAPDVVDLVEDFQDFLGKDSRIALCDGNPFGVPIGMRNTLGVALSDLADALEYCRAQAA